MTEKVTPDTSFSSQNTSFMAASVAIAHGHANKGLPTRVPHLMPFHIQHTGPAPVSTYFRIRPHFSPSLSSPASKTTFTSGDNESGSTTTVADTEVTVEDKESAPLAVADAVVPAAPTAEAEVITKSTASRVQRTGAIARLTDSAKRFVSSFRGRTVHGVEVALPNGFVGIVLRGDAHGKAHQTTASNAKRQPTRLRQPRRRFDVVKEL